MSVFDSAGRPMRMRRHPRFSGDRDFVKARQLQIVMLRLEGHSGAEIARFLGLTHRAVYQTLDCSDAPIRVGLVLQHLREAAS